MYIIMWACEPIHKFFHRIRFLTVNFSSFGIHICVYTYMYALFLCHDYT